MASEHDTSSEVTKNVLRERRHFYTQSEFDKQYFHRPLQPPATFRGKMDMVVRRTGRQLRRAYCHEVPSHQNSDLPLVRQSSSEASEEESESTDSAAKKAASRRSCSLVSSFFLRIFPFINILRAYDLRSGLPNDIICGFTVGIMNIPQGMAYAMLATLPPVYGLYCSLFAPFFYFFLGTSRHLAMGTIAIVSLLVGGSLDRAVAALYTYQNTALVVNVTENSPAIDEDIAIRVALGSALGMTVGLTQLAFGILRLGFVTRFFSDPMISGFTVGSAVQVGVSQLKTIFGLNVPRQSGIFHVPIEIYDICRKLPQTNLVALGLSVVFIALLYSFKRWINPMVMKKIMVPIPMELIVVVLGGVISYVMQLETKYELKVVGVVPSGLPVPRAPDLSIATSMITDIIVIALVAFSISYSLAAVYAKKLGYEVESNQELVAYGMTSILSSFFLCFPAAASLSRSALTVSMNGQTQVAGLVGAAVVLIVVLFAGPLFYPVPNCCLSSIILVALVGMFTQMKCLPRLWRFSIWDFLSWTITFIATIFLDVIYGLIVGILFSAFSVLLRARLQKVEVLGHFGGTEVFDSSADYKVCKESASIKVIRYHGNLFYACGDQFVQSIISAAGFDPRLVRFHEEKLKKDIALLDRQIEFHPDYEAPAGRSISRQTDTVDSWVLGGGDASRENILENGLIVEQQSAVSVVAPTPAGDGIKSPDPGSKQRTHPCDCNCTPGCSRKKLPPVGRLLEKRDSLQSHLDALTAAVPLTHIILDCAPWNFVDIVGLELLQGLIKDFNAIGVQVYLAGVSESVRRSMEQGDFFKTVEASTLFISVFDAFLSIKMTSDSPPTFLKAQSLTAAAEVLLSSGTVELTAVVDP